MVRNDEAPTLLGATRYECLNCGNSSYYKTPPTGPCAWCGSGPDSEPEPARGDSSFYEAEKKRKKQGNKYWRKRFEDQLFAVQQLATFYDPDLRKYPADYWSFSPAYSVVYDRLKAMSDELARLKGIEEECKLLARKLNAVERLAIGDIDQAPSPELESDAFQVVRTLVSIIRAGRAHQPLSDHLVWLTCSCELCADKPEEERARRKVPLSDYKTHDDAFMSAIQRLLAMDAAE